MGAKAAKQTETTGYIPAPCAQSCLTLASPRIVAGQSPLSVELSRQEYWSGLPFPTPRELPNSGIEPKSFMSPALAGT